MAAKAAELLSMRSPSFALDIEEAQCIVAQMRLVRYFDGATVFSAGDDVGTSYMLLLLEGDVSVDTGTLGRAEKVDISVVGPGALLGELALLDGAPRSASCTAVSAITAAGLSAAGLKRLIDSHPKVAAKLVIYLAQSAADRLRALTQQLQMYDELTISMQREIDQLRASKGRVGT